jgi:hypothetical protein
MPCVDTRYRRKPNPHRKDLTLSLHLVSCIHTGSSKSLTRHSNWPITDSDGNNKVAQAVILGLGSMFNHSMQDQNVVWERDTKRQIITYRALRDIPIGEELCTLMFNRLHHMLLTTEGISYGSHLTFKDADAPPPPSPHEELEQLIQIQLD